MTIPSFRKGQILSASNLQELADAVRANRILPGVGVRITGSPNGTTVSADYPRAVSRGPMLHHLQITDLIKAATPVAIVLAVVERIKAEFEEGLPTPDAIASSLYSLISEALLAAIPTAEEIASAVATTVAGVIHNTGATGDFGGLLSGLATANPSVAEYQDTIDELFSTAFSAFDKVDQYLDEEIAKLTGLKDWLEEHFAAEGVSMPRAGDYIYTEELGIIYTIFPVSSQTGIPTSNLIWRIHFKVGPEPEGEDTRQTWCALTTYPVPDLAALIKMLFGIIKDFLKLAISTTTAMTQAATSAAVAATSQLAANTSEGIAEGVGEGISNSLGELSVIGSDGNNETITIFGHVTGPHLFTYPQLIDTTGTAWSAGVFNATAYPFVPGYHASYIGSDGSVWNVPSIFPSIPTPGITERTQIKFIGADGKAYQDDFIWYIGSQTEISLTAPKIKLIDQDGHAQEISIIGEATESGDLRSDMAYLNADGEDVLVKALLWEQTEGVVGLVGFADIEVCENGTPTTKTFLIRNDPEVV